MNRRTLPTALFLLLCSVAAGCSSLGSGRSRLGSRSTRDERPSMGDVRAGAPLSGEIEVAPFGVSVSPGPSPSVEPKSEPQGSFLIFGPGLARAWAAVGVIEAFEAAHQPIVGVAGLETGALIAATYARSGSASRLRWDLMGFTAQLFYSAPRFGLRWMEKPVSVDPLAKALTKVLGGALTEAQKLPVRIAGRTVQREGVLAQRVLESFWNPVLFDPQSAAWSGESFDPRDAWAQLVEGIQADAGATVWVFDWLETESSSTRDESFGGRYAETIRTLMQGFRPPLFFGPNFRVVKVDMKGIGYLDFDKRGDAAFRGKVAARNALADWLRSQTQKLPSSGSEP